MNPSNELSFQRVRTRRVFEEICEQIRQRLSTGVLRPGDKLPAERDMALEFQVSRPAVREALRTLEISGVVSLQKGVKGGAFIREGSPATLTQSLQDLMFLGSVSLASLAEARKIINDAVIKLACERGTEQDFAAIEENIVFIENNEDLLLRGEAGVTFFRLIARATRNEVLILLVDSLSDIIRYVIDKHGRILRPGLFPVRRRILNALRKRDANAARKAMNEYLDIVHGGMLEKETREVAVRKAAQPPRIEAAPKAPAKRAARPAVSVTPAKPARRTAKA